jgi:hypothetical protein
MKTWPKILWRLLAAALVIFIFSSLPDKAQAVNLPCGAAAIYDTNTNGTTKLISSVANNKIYVCGYSIWSAGTVTVGLTYGTGDSCTGAHPITPAFSLITQTGVFDQNSVWRGLPIAPVNNNVCLVTTAGTAVQVIVFYAIFP